MAINATQKTKNNFQNRFFIGHTRKKKRRHAAVHADHAALSAMQRHRSVE
jgi:thioredoxin reductase